MDFNYWFNHFKSNQEHIKGIEKDSYGTIPVEELNPLISSIQQMQRGEHSEGHNLFRMAKNYAKQSQHKDYEDTIKLFIKEEQNHALILSRFMEVHKIPKIHGHWVDSVFRKLRRIFNLKYAIATLLIAETVALVYYDCLRQATKSPMLTAICSQLLRDEHYHVTFQLETINQFESESSSFSNTLLHIYRNVLISGTLPVVWFYHRNVLKAGNLTLASFYSSVKQTLKNYEHQVSSEYTPKTTNHATA